ncbi:MAG: hypothetical protein PHU21_11450 [Elusimicrobia bacterium]|jgi:hypothetical protein|nr:hypothetical protein [Elusimicrobiota bacterium]
MRKWNLGLALLLALGGCRSLGLKDESSAELERNFQESDRQVRENRTLSSLAEMETALAGFVKTEKRIPEKLDELVPKYLAAVPSVDLAVAGHHETNAVKYYPSDLLRGGQLDGTKLRDTGRWGYVHNDRQVVIFVDCTHPTSRGKPWYKERGS